MKPGRPVLRYFSETDLQPVAGRVATARSVNLPPEKDLLDLKDLVEDFAEDGEFITSMDALALKPHLGMFVSMCRVLGAVSVQEIDDTVRVRPSGRLGRHVPAILCVYLERPYTILQNWGSSHLIPEDDVSALEFLHQMELRRIEQERQAGRVPEPLAERPVAFAVFHAKNDKGESCYLFEVNKDWRRLNFIGGKQERQDQGDYLETARREISEELGIARHRLSLTRLNDAPIVGYSLSGNVGSLARYPCVLYGVQVEGELKIRLQDRWLTEATIRQCAELDDRPLMVNPRYLSYLFAGSPSRLSRLPLSTSAKVQDTSFNELVPNGESRVARWGRVVRENKDLVAAVLSLVAALITVVLAF